ncbi:MAG: acylphosphatase [Chitinophagaceae bacterium]
MSLIQKEILIKGKVQGVNYRRSARVQAHILGIRGRIKNLDNGEVWITAEGEESNLELFIQWCWQGPHAAKVFAVLVQEISSENHYNNFEISD